MVANIFPPVRILAVTGHRTLGSAVGVAGAIEAELNALSSPVTGPLTLISCLAEGADRIAAHAILSLPGGILRVVLPFAPDVYESDFGSPASRAEFRALLADAAEVVIVPVQGRRSECYRAAGCAAVDACDMLLAVWNGLPGRGIGGTAAIVGYARTCGKPLVIIDSSDPACVTRERLGGAGGHTAE